jgi:hypothetical protein
MSTYVIVSSYGFDVISASSENDAIQKLTYNRDPRREGNDSSAEGWDKWMTFDLSIHIRPATVREALTEHYGDNYVRSIEHIATVVNTYRTNGEDMLVFNGAKKNDVHGYDDAVDVSNFRVLEDNWQHLDGFGRGPWSNVDAISLLLDQEAPSDLIEVLDGLADYPLLSDDEHSRVEQEMIQEHWESYGRYDVIRTVEKALDVDELTDAAHEIINELVCSGILDYGVGGGYPTMIDSSACDFGDDDVAAFFVEHRGNVVTVKPHNGYGDPVTFDLTDANIIESA